MSEEMRKNEAATAAAAARFCVRGGDAGTKWGKRMEISTIFLSFASALLLSEISFSR